MNKCKWISDVYFLEIGKSCQIASDINRKLNTLDCGRQYYMQEALFTVSVCYLDNQESLNFFF